MFIAIATIFAWVILFSEFKKAIFPKRGRNITVAASLQDNDPDYRAYSESFMAPIIEKHKGYESWTNHCIVDEDFLAMFSTLLEPGRRLELVADGEVIKVKVFDEIVGDFFVPDNHPLKKQIMTDGHIDAYLSYRDLRVVDDNFDMFDITVFYKP